MATAYLFVDFLESASLGLSGGSIELPFIIEIDAIGDDPYVPWFAACPFNCALRQVAGMPIAIARRFVGLFATEFSNPVLLNEKTYRGVVTFSPATDRTIGLWRRTVQFSSQTKPFQWSLEERDQSGNITQINGEQVGQSKRVGTNEYKLTDDAQADYFIKDPVPNSSNVLFKKCHRTGNIIDANHSVNDSITAITYDAIVPQLSSQAIRDIGNLKWNCNIVEWNGYQTWSMIFSNFEAFDEVLVLPGNQALVQWYSNVRVELLYWPINKDVNPHGWRALVLPDVIKFDNGATREVFRATGGNFNRSANTFVQYKQVNFNYLFMLFRAAAGVPLI